jgi:hypothetical protein
MVLKTLPPTPTRKRQASIPARLVTNPQASWNTTNTTPEMEKTGYRPLISLNGARTMGARANPTQKVVIPVKTAVLEAWNSASMMAAGGEYEPAQYAVSSVATQQRTMW